MIKTNDGKQTKRLAGKTGDRSPQTGLKRERAVYIASGGETSIDFSTLTPPMAFLPGSNQLTVKRSSGGNLICGLDFFETSSSGISFPSSEPLTEGEWVEIIKEVNITGVMAATLRPDIHTETAKAGQTVVSADFSWTYNLNPSKGVGGVEVYVFGTLQTRGIDYKEIDLGNANTNQIEFFEALEGGENIILKPTYHVIDQTAAATSFQSEQINQLQSILSSITTAFVDETDQINVVHTLAGNRAKIPNIAEDLKVSFGIDRIMFHGLYFMPNEYGPNGEQVFGVMGDDRGLIRLLGAGWYEDNSSSGVSLFGNSGDYFEITFYGTGLNILTEYYYLNRQITPSIDGGSDQTPIIVSGSTILNDRNFGPNQVVNVFKNLSLGIHTARLKITSGFRFYGAEIVNGNSSGLVNVNQGSAFVQGKNLLLTSSHQFEYNVGATGTKGGRQLVYLKSDGTVNTLFNPVDGAAKYLNQADHSNEEVARVYNWREFSSSLSSADFGSVNSLNSLNPSYCLDDGSTLLVGNGIKSWGVFVENKSFEVIALNEYPGSISFTFTGCGIDLIRDARAYYPPYCQIWLDGVNLGSYPRKSNPGETIKIASGLPYGSHTVKITNVDYYSQAFLFQAFKVYQPKKPNIPYGSIELADYNILANYSASVSSTATNPVRSAGILHKSPNREVIYSGAWFLGINSFYESSFFASSQTINDYFEYTFFGTGIEIGVQATTNVTLNVKIDGSDYTGAASVSRSGSWNSANSSWVSSVGSGELLQISGLPLGIHTVRVTRTGGSGDHYLHALNVITPIHSYKSIDKSLYMNTISVGSQGLLDTRPSIPFKEQKERSRGFAKAEASSLISTTSTEYIPVPQMSLSVNCKSKALKISFHANAFGSNTTNKSIKIYVDGGPVGVVSTIDSAVSNADTTISGSTIINVSEGIHHIALYWSTSSSGTMYLKDRTLLVEEL